MAQTAKGIRMGRLLPSDSVVSLVDPNIYNCRSQNRPCAIPLIKACIVEAVRS
jgi:hypothetical protein